MNNANPNDQFDFAEWLASLGHGSTNQRAGDRLREVVAACNESGGKGKLVLTFNVSADDGRADIEPDIKITKPDKKLPRGVFFATEEGALVTEDPKQLKLPVKNLAPTPIRGGGAS